MECGATLALYRHTKSHALLRMLDSVDRVEQSQQSSLSYVFLIPWYSLWFRLSCPLAVLAVAATWSGCDIMFVT